MMQVRTGHFSKGFFGFGQGQQSGEHHFAAFHLRLRWSLFKQISAGAGEQQKKTGIVDNGNPPSSEARLAFGAFL